MAPRKRKAGKRRSKAMQADDQWYVDGLLEERTNANGESEYLVKWTGYSDEEATWRPEEDIHEDIVAEWKEAQANQGAVEDQENDQDEEEIEQEADDVLGTVLNTPKNKSYGGRVVGSAAPSRLILTPKAVLDREGADRIIGDDGTRYLLSHHPNPVTNEERVMWLEHRLLDAGRVRAWNKLVENFNEAENIIHEAEEDESSEGARFFGQYDYFRNGEALFIQRLFQENRRGLEANLIDAGVMDHPAQPSDPLFEEESDEGEMEDDAGEMEEDAEEMDSDDWDNQTSVSNQRQSSTEALTNGSYTNIDSIERGNDTENPPYEASREGSAATDDDADWIMQQWSEPSMFPLFPKK